MRQRVTSDDDPDRHDHVLADADCAAGARQPLDRAARGAAAALDEAIDAGRGALAARQRARLWRLTGARDFLAAVATSLQPPRDSGASRRRRDATPTSTHGERDSSPRCRAPVGSSGRASDHRQITSSSARSRPIILGARQEGRPDAARLERAAQLAVGSSRPGTGR